MIDSLCSVCFGLFFAGAVKLTSRSLCAVYGVG